MKTLPNSNLTFVIFVTVTNGIESQPNQPNDLYTFLHGFKECIADATKFFQEVEELDVSEGRCHRLIQHLKKQLLRYENKELAPVRNSGDDRVWEGSDSNEDFTSRRSSGISISNLHFVIHPAVITCIC